MLLKKRGPKRVNVDESGYGVFVRCVSRMSEGTSSELVRWARANQRKM